MRCPHCRATVPPERHGPNGGQCPECRRLFVTGRTVAYTAFTPGFLRGRVAGLGGAGELRLSSLQLQADARKQRPYPLVPRAPWWRVEGYDFHRPPRRSVVMGLAVLAAAAYFPVFRWHWPEWAVAILVVVGLPTAIPVASLLGLVFHVLVRIPVLLVRAPVRLVRALTPDRQKVVFTPSAFTAHARTVGADVVDEHGLEPPPAPDPVRFAVLCPDPGVAACLWANDVGGRLGALVVTAKEDIRPRTPILDLTDRTPADKPTELLTAVLLFARNHHDAGPTGFLSEPVSPVTG